MDNKIIIFDENQNEEIVPQIKGLKVTFKGKNNVVKIGKGSIFYSSHIILQNRCKVNIKRTNKYGIRNLSAELTDNCSIKIGKDFSSVSVRFSQGQEKNLNVTIGDYCMCATNVILRPTDGHAIYDIGTNELLNKGEDIIIGDHVWLGLDSLILKGAHVSNNTVIGANSLVNKKFKEENIIIAGSPAKIIKRNVNWDRKNPNLYEDEKRKKKSSFVKQSLSMMKKNVNGVMKNILVKDSKNNINSLKSPVNEDTSKLSIIFISDDNYATYTAVAINSLNINRDKNNSYEIFVISHGISSINKDKLKKLSNKDFLVKIIDIQDTKEYSSVKKHRAHVSETAMFKFDIPNILKSHDKVLYIDSDVLILKDLKDLFNMDFEDNYAVVVKDILSIKNRKHLKSLNFECDFYFNSGVMLLNLKKLREDNVSEKLIEYRKNKINHFMDQDAFNVVFCNNVKYAPLKYNLLNFYFDALPIEKLEKFYDEKLSPEIIENYKNTSILHMGGAEKPWNTWMDYLTSTYLKYSFSYSYNLFLKILMRLIKKLFVKSTFDGISSFIYVIKNEYRDPKNIYRIFKARRQINSLNLFDDDYYLIKYPDVRYSNLNPLDHYIYHGWKEKRIPSAEFDGNYYLRRYPDVRRSKVCPLVHYVLNGKKERRITNKNTETNTPQNRINTNEKLPSY